MSAPRGGWTGTEVVGTLLVLAFVAGVVTKWLGWW